MTPRAELPSYRELADAEPPYSAWSIPGIDPRLGMLSLIDAEKSMAALALPRRGAVFRLDVTLDAFEPPIYGRAQVEQEVIEIGGIVFDEVISKWNTQGSSQWDGFRHIRHPVHGFFGGLPAEEHGVEHWGRAGIVTRGVLADVGRYRESAGRPLNMCEPDPIEIEDVEAALAAGGATVEQGDVLLVRTGWIEWFLALPPEERAEAAAVPAAPGLRSDPSFIEYLWDLHIAGVAGDNPSLEVWPAGKLVDPQVRRAARTDRGRLTEVFMHYALLPLLGMPIGELWDLGALAADCAQDGRYAFLLCSTPAMLHRGVGTPPNAVAIK
jgi:hypothetical protein